MKQVQINPVKSSEYEIIILCLSQTIEDERLFTSVDLD